MFKIFDFCIFVNYIDFILWLNQYISCKCKYNFYSIEPKKIAKINVAIASEKSNKCTNAVALVVRAITLWGAIQKRIHEPIYKPIQKVKQRD